MAIRLAKSSFLNRAAEAGRLLLNRQSAPNYKIKDLSRIVNYVIARTKNERSFRNEYGAAGEGRLRSDWDSRTGTPYEELNSKHNIMIARSRDLYKNDSIYKAAINTVIDNVIGTGLWPKPKVKGKDGRLNTALNKKLEYWFNVYSKPSQWDARKKFTYIGDGQRMILRTIILSGDCFLNAVKNANANPVCPVSWQMFEIDRLNNAMDSYYRTNDQSSNVKQTVHGINISDLGEEISYWIKGQEKAIPKDRILHTYMADRPEQYIGLPLAIAALADIYDKHDLLEDYVLKSRAIARVLWFLSNENDSVPYSDDDKGSGLEIDSVSQMRGDKAPEQIKMPDSVSETVQPLVKMLTHGITAGLGTSYTTVTRDMDGVNFAASKFIDIQEWRRFTALKDFFVYDHCNPFYEKFVDFMTVSDKIPELKNEFYRKNNEMLYEVEWVGNGKSDVDPLKDANADVLLLRNGLTTYSAVLNKRGSDADDTIENIVEERQKLKDNGVVLDFMVQKVSNQESEIDAKLEEVENKLHAIEGRLSEQVV